MSYYKRAIISIRRNIGKTILLFLIVLILGSVISGAISTNRATENMESNLIDAMLPMAIVQFNWELFEEYRDEDQSWFLSPDLIREIGALPYVRSYDFFTHAWLYSDMEEVRPDMGDDGGFISGGWGPGDAFGTMFRMRGVENPNLLDIEQNLIELVSGRVFTNEEVRSFSTVAIVSEEFAQLNGLHVGSTFTFRNIVFDINREIMWGRDADELADAIYAEQTYEMEVIGIFRLLNLQIHDNDDMNAWAVSDLQNRIYVPNTFIDMTNRFHNDMLMEMMPDIFGDTDPDEFVMWENFFTLYDPNDFQAFREAVAWIVPPFFEVVDTANSFIPVLSALDTMKGLTLMILYIAVGASLVIIALLITLFLRDRRREVGIYLALGEKKGKIVTQFLLEIITVAFLAIAVALFIGSIIAANLSEDMLMNDIALEQQRAGNNMDPWGDPFANMGFRTDVSADVIAGSYDVSLTPFTILLFFSVGLGTVLVATVVPMIYVLRLNPKKIML